MFGAIGMDPVELGLAKSLARPGYNITGMSLQTSELAAKRLELIKQIVPTATRIAILLPDIDTSRRLARDHEVPARALGVELMHLEVRGPSDFEMAFDKARRQQAHAMVLTQNALFFVEAKAIADLSLKYRLPVLSGDTGFAAAGGLINQGPDSPEFVEEVSNPGRQDPERCKARRLANRATNQVRSGREPQDREGAWGHDTPRGARSG